MWNNPLLNEVDSTFFLESKQKRTNHWTLYVRQPLNVMLIKVLTSWFPWISGASNLCCLTKKREVSLNDNTECWPFPEKESQTPLILKNGVTGSVSAEIWTWRSNISFSAVTGSPFRWVQVQCMFNKRTTCFPHQCSDFQVSYWQKYSLKSQSCNLFLLSSSWHCCCCC